MFLLPNFILITRTSVLEAVGELYVVTARAEGLSERVVMLQHVMPNAINPVLSFLGLQIGRLMGGSIITETIFASPGVGRRMLGSIFQRNVPVVVASVSVVSIAIIIANFGGRHGAADDRSTHPAALAHVRSRCQPFPGHLQRPLGRRGEEAGATPLEEAGATPLKDPLAGCRAPPWLARSTPLTVCSPGWARLVPCLRAMVGIRAAPRLSTGTDSQDRMDHGQNAVPRLRKSCPCVGQRSARWRSPQIGRVSRAGGCSAKTSRVC